MKYNTHSRANARRRRQDRLSRLPAFVQALARNKRGMRMYLAMEPYARVLVAARMVSEPGFGLAQHDAAISILRELADEIELSDIEFETALRIMTAPEGIQ